MKSLQKLLFLLNSSERKQAGMLLIIITLMALLDMIGVASILPFMAVLTNPGLIETNLVLNYMYKSAAIFGVKNYEHFLFLLGILVFILLITSLITKAFTTYLQVRFVQMREYSIGRRLIEIYLHQPYSWFLSRHSADLGKTILSEVQQIISNGIRPLLDLISRGMVVIALITLLIFVDPKLALISGFTLTGAYVLIYYFVRKYLDQTGKERLKNNQLRFTVVSEAFNATKEVKVGGLEETYIKFFSKSAKIYARTQASSQVVAQLPRYFLEAIAFGGVLLILLYIMRLTGSFNNALPIISLYVFAGYRLLPALQQVYGSFTQLTFVGPSLNKLYEDLKNIKPLKNTQSKKTLPLKKAIILKNIYFHYPNSSRIALKNVSLTIPAKSTIGLVGATGSGKTTSVDIILGLLQAQKGTLEVDGIVITRKNARSWQQSIGYVPQHIYLSDDTIASNIAFGLNAKHINQNKIEKAAKIANLHKFVVDELPDQYQTKIGERGVRLSGGQRQRIGIARALYNNPQLLILDEATSALDNKTEEIIMEAVNNLSKETTIIIIAHRLNTVKNCDIIFKLDNGKLINQGTYKKIIRNK